MLLDKLNNLGNAASWDSCGGVKQKSFRKAGIPLQYEKFVHDCSGTSEACRLMKVLQSNKCIHDCRYCVNSGGKQQKTELSPLEMADGFELLWRRGIVEGLFLSSAVTKNAEETTEKMIESARIIRRNGFKGYIHLKVLPSTPKHQIFEMAGIASRISLNIETPSKEYLSELGSTKDYFNDLEKRIKWISEAKGKGLVHSFTTQFMVGGAGEKDEEIIKKMNSLYENTLLYRSYFSAFQPIKGTPMEKMNAENESREYSLYQVDWLLRIYGFSEKEISSVLNEKGFLPLGKDVKREIALKNEGMFPVDINNAGKEELLRVPAIGPKTVEKIIQRREKKKFMELRELKEIGLITRKAQVFIQLEKGIQKSIFSFV